MLNRRPRSLLVLFGVVALVAGGCDAPSGNDDAAGDGSGTEQTAPELDTGDGADDVTSDDESDPDATGTGDPDDTESGDEPAGDEHADERVVELYFTSEERGDIEDVFPVERTVPTPDVLHGALEELLAGPTAEEEAEGYAGFFSDETAGMLNGAEIEGGVARVDLDADLRDALPNAGTSTGALTLLAQLDGTVEQFSTVDEAIYSLDGDVDAFYAWLQLAVPER
jgi:hypothetical protein